MIVYGLINIHMIYVLHMGTFYLDIETSGLKPESSKIITIQYQALERSDGTPKGPLIILKEWELTEREMIRRFIDNTEIASSKSFDFVPVGYNLRFEQSFLNYKSKLYNLPIIDIHDKPMLDLSTTGVLMNNCKFYGSGLDRITGKSQSGSEIASWYANERYDEIIHYIEDETREFLKFFGWLCKEMPVLHKKFVTYIR